MKAIRLILIFLVGGALIYFTHKSKYQSFFFDAVISMFLFFLAGILLLWSVVKDLKNYQSNKQLLNFATTMTAVLFALIIMVMEHNINKNFDKPTLIEVFYNGDYNGAGIDFKTDGTYIFDISALGLTNFQYGTYKISGDKIVIDKINLDGVVVTNLLEVRNQQVQYQDSTRSELYLYQVSNTGVVIDNTFEFRVVVDNRREKSRSSEYTRARL